jgi:hypothetical protein
MYVHFLTKDVDDDESENSLTLKSLMWFQDLPLMLCTK